MKNEFARKLLLLTANFGLATDAAAHLYYSMCENLLAVVGNDVNEVLYDDFITPELRSTHLLDFGTSTMFHIVVDSAKTVFKHRGGTYDAAEAI